MKHFELIESPLQGRNLIEASAGTGKTFTIAVLFLRLLLEKGLEVRQILVVTFTEAATEELRDRIRKRIREALQSFEEGRTEDPFLAALLKAFPDRETAILRLSQALLSFDEAAIFTIHGFCQRTLQDRAFSTSGRFDTELVTDSSQMVLEQVRDFLRSRMGDWTPTQVSYFEKKGVSPENLVSFLRGKLGGEPPQIYAPAPPPDLLALEAQADTLFQRAAALWYEDREGIAAALQSPNLHGGKYRPSSVVKWCGELDLWFATRDLLGMPEKLQKFTPEALAGGVKKGKTPPAHSFFPAAQQLLEAIEVLQGALCASFQHLRLECLMAVRESMARLKNERNVRFFDDLIEDVEKSLQGPGGQSLAQELRRRYPAALIDEFQDTDPIQYAIFHAVYPDADAVLFFIGDPKQAIYSFRGADIYAYLRASRQVEHRYSLGTNYRSTPNLVEGINRLFAMHPRPFVQQEIGFEPVSSGQRRSMLRERGAGEAALNFWLLPPPEKKTWPKKDARQMLAQATAGEIARLVNCAARGDLHIEDVESGEQLCPGPGDMAVLVRSHFEARMIQEALRDCGLPSVMQGTGSIFRSDEAKSLLMILRSVLNPRHEGLLRAALLTKELGRRGDDLQALSAVETAWELLQGRFETYSELWRKRGLYVMTMRLLSDEAVRERLLARPGGDRALTNLLHALELLHAKASQERLGPRALVQWFERQIEEGPDQDEAMIRLESDEDAVQIVTIHKSKGLEYPIVFCPFCWSGSKVGTEDFRFHDPKKDYRLSLELGSPASQEHRVQALKEDLAENLRLLYVAMTRARYRCVVAFGEINEAQTSALAWLLLGRDLRGDDFEQAMNKTLGEGSWNLREALSPVIDSADGAVSLEELPEGTEPLSLLPKALAGRDARIFQRELDRHWAIASFTRFVATASAAVDAPGWDEGPDEIQGAELSADEDSIFAFPKGATPGSCLHDILERLDFTTRLDEPAGAAQVRELIRQSLDAYGLEERWCETVFAMVGRLLKTQLSVGQGEGVQLCFVDSRQRIAEMEFYFPLGRVGPQELKAVFDRHAATLKFGTAWLAGLNFSTLHGMVKGYIDLIFEAEGKFYVADWKSNHLGGRYEDYHSGALQGSMTRSHYILQYHLYVLALHRYLKLRLPGYRYEKDFGGVFYIYLRGVQGDGSKTGIYSDLPPVSLLEDLERLLCREGSP